MRRVFLADLKRALFSWGFIIGMLGMFFGGILNSIPYMQQIWDMGNSLQEPAFISITKYCLYIDFFVMLIPIACPLAFGAVFEDEVRSRFVIQGLPRAGRRKYLISKILTPAVAGGLMVLGACLLSLLLNFFLFPINEEQQTMISINSSVYLLEFLKIIGVRFLAGALWGMGGSLAAAVTKNRYMAYAAPFIIYYILTTFQERYYKTLYWLSPRQWILFIQIEAWQATLILCGLILILGGVYAFVIKRRLVNV